jgi:hypothetical protein
MFGIFIVLGSSLFSGKSTCCAYIMLGSPHHITLKLVDLSFPKVRKFDGVGE